MALAQKLGSTLKGSNGTVESATALDKDVVGLYFSAHWCPPCRRFTPVLGQKYTELKNAGKSFELVFVSSDRDESSFNEYHGSMPFLALPFGERKLKQQLSSEFGVRGIPMLILLDGKTGELITKKGRDAISSANVVSEFPFDSYRPLFGKNASVLQQLGSTLQGNNGQVDTATAIEGKEAIGLYFSAHWCPPCRGFTPVLGEKYNALKNAGKGFELVFVSSDRDQSSFDEYSGSMPFLALPFSERARKEQLSELYEVQGIPSLVILDAKTGKIINKSARGAISADTFVEDFPFHPKPMYDMSESLEGINSLPSLVVLMEKAPQETQTAISAILMQIAVNEKKKPEAERRVGMFFTGCGGGPIDQIRSKCGMGPATASPQMLILDLNSQGAIYKPTPLTAPVTADSIEMFLMAFKAGALDRGTFGR